MKCRLFYVHLIRGGENDRLIVEYFFSIAHVVGVNLHRTNKNIVRRVEHVRF